MKKYILARTKRVNNAVATEVYNGLFDDSQAGKLLEFTEKNETYFIAGIDEKLPDVDLVNLDIDDNQFMYLTSDVVNAGVKYFIDSQLRVYTIVNNILYENEYGTDNMIVVNKDESIILREIDIDTFRDMKQQRTALLLDLYKKAIEVATSAHKGQVDKAGVDYINHPIAVAKLCDGLDTKIVAILHDVIEDTSVTAQYLLNRGFPEYLVEAIMLVTKVKDEQYSYEKYLKNIKANRIAKTVKLADLTHNSDLRRLPEISDEMMAKYKKYIHSMNYLKGLEEF